MEKVSLSKLQMELLGISLKAAKQNVDDLLDGRTVEIEAPSLTVGQEFVKKATEIGVNCRLVDS